ncbi:chemotaxis protein CheB [Aestuariicoccus sp. MJ-SS9]|uniref:chemotaxis protein CheB n=1 Tax=Aestuariicoccus sp. MJ-SS9 TaxID=3079855 RepID=UPI00290A5920|nr:chemotaxis protein CheB [Aestuariicoccus sp. MJ-SS9]MDU8913676.1 CheR family methyltransferase [Aestuariicoccus sp. MJ-SS9]
MGNWGGVVGIVASAGGLEAMSLLAQNLPKKSGAVYVLAQHMSPTHKSLLGQLIARETTLPVVEIESGVVPEPDTIYFTPPNSNVILKDGELRLVEPSGHPATPKPSGDLLLKSIARECGEKCVAIILSGTGSDGSYGVQAVREAGGITIAQDPASAKYDGMPSSAIETGCIDLTLIPEQIGQHLENILSAPRDFGALRQINMKSNRLADLLQIVFARTRVNFRDYKESTINRRIARRMTALSIERYEDYVDYCRSSQNEVDALFRDFLISVTRFFRDPEQFEQLFEEIRELVENKEDDPVRVWIAGCATGEEAYSIAILLAEAMGGLAELRKSRVQIFATDIDARALGIARIGSYPATAANDIPHAYLSKYFTLDGDRIEVKPELRSVMLFSQHNIFQDPPFLNLDLASIRNVLIYFNPGLQEKVLSRLHYALAADGVLFLGTSETVGVVDVLFEGRSRGDKIFGKRSLSRRIAGDFEPMTTELTMPPRAQTSDAAKVLAQKDGFRQFEALLRAVAPQGFIATRGGEIVRVVGDITEFAALSETSSLKLNVRLLRRELGEDAQNLIAVSSRSKQKRTGQWVPFARGSEAIEVRLHCYPFKSDGSSEETFLLAFESREPQHLSERDVDEMSDAERTDYIRKVEREMASTKDTLQQTVEELQTSNEELQSLNEELQSTNEELQATNEELETSNEELQSTNEELITVNEEMQINSAELHKVSTELSATFAYAPFPMLMALLQKSVGEGFTS